MATIATPYDEEIAKVSGRLGRTVVVYGESGAQEEVRESKTAKAAAAPASVAADRAAYNLASGGKAIQGAGDLVEDIRSGAVDLAKVAKDELPAEMQKMSAEQQAVRAGAQGGAGRAERAHGGAGPAARGVDREGAEAAGGGGRRGLLRPPGSAEIIAEQAARKLRKG